MVKVAILALFCCVALVSAKPAFKDTKTILAELEQHHFGHSMISLVQANMAAGNPIEFVLETLEMVRNNLENEQDAADKKNATDQAECDDEINKLVSTISDLQRTIESLKTVISENEVILATAQKSLAEAEHDFETVVKSIETGTAQREAEHKEWASKDYELSIDITTVEEGIRLVQHMLHGVSFAEIEGRYNKVLVQMKERSTSMFKPMVVQLTQLASKFSYENVVKVLELLDNIRKSFVDEQTNLKLSEEQAQRDWEKLLAQLTSEKNALESKINRLKNLISTTQETLKNARASLASNQLSLEDNQDQLNSVTEQCNAASVKYLTETAEREREIDIIGQLIEHIQNKVAQIAAYLADREANAPTGF